MGVVDDVVAGVEVLEDPLRTPPSGTGAAMCRTSTGEVGLGEHRHADVGQHGAAIERGDRVSVRGHFRASDQAVVEEDRLVHHLWVWKQRLGLLGLVLAVLMAPLCFTIRDGRVVERG